jgi:hypothetical protein
MLKATGRARVDSRHPEAFAVCDTCGFWRNRSDLRADRQYQGNEIIDTGFLVCFDTCLDIPQAQNSTPILPADPRPVLNPRPELNRSDFGFESAASTDPASNQIQVGELP